MKNYPTRKELSAALTSNKSPMQTLVFEKYVTFKIEKEKGGFSVNFNFNFKDAPDAIRDTLHEAIESKRSLSRFSHDPDGKRLEIFSIKSKFGSYVLPSTSKPLDYEGVISDNSIARKCITEAFINTVGNDFNKKIAEKIMIAVHADKNGISPKESARVINKEAKSPLGSSKAPKVEPGRLKKFISNVFSNTNSPAMG